MHNDYNVNSNLELIIMINAHARFTPMLTIETKMCHVLIMCKTINSYIYMYVSTSAFYWLLKSDHIILYTEMYV